MEKTLLHICCAPCSVMCIETLRAEGIEPTGYWYNPNIHPVTEYRARRDTLIQYAKDINMELILKDDYGLREFVRAVYPALEDRCGVCYELPTTLVGKVAYRVLEEEEAAKRGEKLPQAVRWAQI